MVAILLVEAYGIAFPDYAGGIKDPNYDEMGIFQTVIYYQKFRSVKMF